VRVLFCGPNVRLERQTDNMPWLSFGFYEDMSPPPPSFVSPFVQPVRPNMEMERGGFSIRVASSQMPVNGQSMHMSLLCLF
jgi:hypothetical protein